MRYLLPIDCNFCSYYSIFIVLWRICLKLFDESRKQFFTNPSTFGESFVSVGIRSDESEWKAMNVFWFLFFVVFLHYKFLL